MKRISTTITAIIVGMALIWVYYNTQQDDAATQPTAKPGGITAVPSVSARQIKLQPIITSAPDRSIVVGQVLAYDLTITNHKSWDATGASISDALPVGVEFISVYPAYYAAGIHCRARRRGQADTNGAGLVLGDVEHLPRIAHEEPEYGNTIVCVV